MSPLEGHEMFSKKNNIKSSDAKEVFSNIKKLKHDPSAESKLIEILTQQNPFKFPAPYAFKYLKNYLEKLLRLLKRKLIQESEPPKYSEK